MADNGYLHGPWDTEREVLASVPAGQLAAARDTDDPTPTLTFLTGACDAAGIALGTADLQALRQITGEDIATVVVIGDLITRVAEAGRQLEPEPGTVTEWAVRYKGRWGSRESVHIQPYDDEDMSRRAAREVAEWAPHEEPRVMYREVGPWKEAPDAGSTRQQTYSD